jgi:hypothetical protein
MLFAITTPEDSIDSQTGSQRHSVRVLLGLSREEVAERAPADNRTSACAAVRLMLARLGRLAQFSEALAIAPRALGSARRLTAKRRTPFPPRAHYELGTWF